MIDQIELENNPKNLENIEFFIYKYFHDDYNNYLKIIYPKPDLL
jgi:hypothetical protein